MRAHACCIQALNRPRFCQVAGAVLSMSGDPTTTLVTGVTGWTMCLRSHITPCNILHTWGRVPNEAAGSPDGCGPQRGTR